MSGRRRRSSHGARAPRLGIAALGAMALSCGGQPAFECTVTHGSFAARYTLVEASGECQPRAGEVIGVGQYERRNGDQLEFGEGTLVLQAESMASAAFASALTDPNLDHALYAAGKYDSAQPRNGLCTVPTLSPAILELPEYEPGPEPAPSDDDGDEPPEPDGCEPALPEPALYLEYEWSNVKVRVSAAEPGQRFSAELATIQNGCTARYDVTAVFPAVYCGEPAVPPESCDDRTPCARGTCVDGACVQTCSDEQPCAEGTCMTGQCLLPNDDLCAAKADPAAGRPLGSGINPDFSVECARDLMLCVLKDE